MELECNYEGCNKQFSSSQERLVHAMEEHHGLEPEDYPNMTGRGNSGGVFDF